jgi:hypothetical protein
MNYTEWYAEEKLDKIGVRLEYLPYKSVTALAHLTHFSTVTAWRATKKLHLIKSDKFKQLKKVIT